MQLQEKIEEFGLDAYAGAMLAVARTSIRLTVTGDRGGDDDTRLGGPALLPEGLATPRWKDREQALIAQIMLRDVAHLDRQQVLPRDGRLLFFYDQEQETWGSSAKDRGSWTVLYGPEGTATVTGDAIYSSRRLEPSAEISLPPSESLPYEGLDVDEEDLDAYEALRESLQPDGDVVTKLLGYPDLIQDPMERECELNWRASENDRGAVNIRAGARDWRLLLQVDSEEAAGMMWGDAGRLYYWIRRQDLESRNFGASWLILQCY